ncbi:MAG: caspase family protein [Melioribacteraceae bacterium]|nr:caspase family protein [Melioribacteraceae bacterium]
MKIAIVVGISEHDNVSYNLTAPQNDVDYIYEALHETGNYEELLKISEKLSSVKLKERITDFIEKFKEQDIEEVFFYFSGHGNFDGKEFHFILSDYKDTQPKQTSLENSELDSWLKSTNPQLVIKVVDACNAGVQYVKDPQAFKKYIDDSNKKFNNCYFMFSSLSNQSSVASDKISLFTSSFLHSLTTNANAIIRYKDIIDYISDDFENNTYQTPYFLVQATNTEKFGAVSEAYRKKVDDFMADKVKNDDIKDDEKETTPDILDFVKKEAAKYCTEDELISRLEHIKNQIIDYKLNSELSNLYDIKSTFLEEYGSFFKGLNQIGDWLEENDAKYFAEVKREQEAYYIADPFDAMTALTGGERRKIKKYREVIVGIEITQEVPYKAIEIIGYPKYENLEYNGLLLLFVFSKTKIRFFYSFISFKQLNWNEKRIKGETKWKTLECDLKDIETVSNEINNILGMYQKFILDPLENRFRDDVN